MKQLKMLVLLGLLLSLMSACGGSGGATAPTSAAATTAATSAVPAAATTVATTATTSADATAGAGGVAATAVAGSLPDLGGREVRIAVENTYPPFNYINPTTNQGEGWDYDAWKEICRLLNCKPVLQETTWEGMIQAVANKQFDVGADGITITPERAKQVDFSKGYIRVDQRLLVRADEARFKTMDEFVANEQLRLGTQTGTTNYETAKGRLPEGRIQAFEQFPFAVAALINGDVDAVIMDETAGQGYVGTNAAQLKLTGDPIKSDELGFIFPKGSALVEPVNMALAEMQQRGKLDELAEAYFSTKFKLPGS